MRRMKKKRKNFVGRSLQMSVVSTVILILLMFCYLAMTIVNSTKLAD